MSVEHVQQLAEAVGGTIENAGQLPDGSGFAVMSMPLPRDHWSTANPDEFGVPPMGLRLGTDSPDHQRMCEIIRAAGRYAYRASTMNGKESDLDPDALIQNFIVGLIGLHTPDGLSSDAWANPRSIPPRVTIDFNEENARRMAGLERLALTYDAVDFGKGPDGGYEFWRIDGELLAHGATVGELLDAIATDATPLTTGGANG